MKIKAKVLEVGHICRGSDGGNRPGVRLELIPEGLQLGGEFVMPTCIGDAREIAGHIYGEVLITVEPVVSMPAQPVKP